MPSLRVLLVADSHIGLDLPWRPRISRRRRGHDFLAAFDRALSPARRGEVDLVVHGGDLLYRSRVPPELVQTAMAPLLDVAERGVPVFLVPGNHERSAIPYPLLARHPLIHIFDRPRCYRMRDLGTTLIGWPFHRLAGQRFDDLIRQTGWVPGTSPLSVLCLHQAVEGARVGIQDFEFRHGHEVIRRRDVARQGLTAVLSGHIHRGQVLRAGETPVLYPGSVERTSLAERLEPKGYMVLRLAPERVTWRFVELPARPMVCLEAHQLDRLATLDPNAVVRVRPGASQLTAAGLRARVPWTMNIDLVRPVR